jgi:type II secretory pathway pseudopilin PulG
MTARRRGFTLIEALVAGGLFVVIGSIAFMLIKYGMNAQQRGLMDTDAQRAVRESVNRIQADIQSGMPLQIPLLGVESPPGAVLMPSGEAAQSVDDVMFTVPAVENLGTLNTSVAANYLLVRYAVYNHDPDKASDRATSILRRVYRFDEVADFMVTGTDPASTSGRSVYHIDRTALDNKYGKPGDESKHGSASNDVGSDGNAWQEVVTLGGPFDLISFTVSHTPNQNTVQTSYDVFHFTVSATAERYLGTPVKYSGGADRKLDIDSANDKQNDRVVRSLSSEATINRSQ